MDDEYKNFFFNKEYLESIYNMLKGDEKDLKRENVRKYIESVEGVEYEEIEEENRDGESNNNADSNIYISFEEFCSMFQKIYESSQNPKQIFLEGFALLDNSKKGYIDLDDLKKINSVLNQHFSEDDLEGLLETAGKSDSKITFENFLEFLTNEN